MSGTFNLLSFSLFNKYIIDSWFVFIIHTVDFFQFLPQAAVNHTKGSHQHLLYSGNLQQLKTEILPSNLEFKNASTLGKNREGVHSKFGV